LLVTAQVVGRSCCLDRCSDLKIEWYERLGYLAFHLIPLKVKGLSKMKKPSTVTSKAGSDCFRLGAF
jgi:hypothetical protein